MSEHAVNAIRLFVNVFEKENRSTRLDFVRRSHRRRDQREVAANQAAGSETGPKRTHGMTRAQFVAFRRIGYLANGLGLEQCFAKILLRVIGKARQRNRAMKGDQPGMSVQRQMHRRNVAIAKEDLWIAANQIIVNTIQQMHGTIAAANGEDRLHLRVAKHRVQVVQTFVNREAIVAHSLARILRQLHTQAEVLHRAFGERETVRVGYVGRGRNQANCIARSQSFRANQVTSDSCVTREVPLHQRKRQSGAETVQEISPFQNRLSVRLFPGWSSS